MALKLISRDYLKINTPKLNNITIKIGSRRCSISFSDDFLYLSFQKLDKLRNDIESLILFRFVPYSEYEIEEGLWKRKDETKKIEERLKNKRSEYWQNKSIENISLKLGKDFLKRQNDDPVYLTTNVDVTRYFVEDDWELFLEDEDELKEERNTIKNYRFYVFKNDLYFFDDKDNHHTDEQKLLIKEKYYKREQKFKKLQKEIRLFQKLESDGFNIIREKIPEEVRFVVWRRDGGKCVKCGSKKNLEFDHIIPFSKGGSSSDRNLQLLCQKCNREKSNKI